MTAALQLLEEAASGLPYTQRKMMGHDCLFAPGGIFALIADEDRIGLRIADPDAHARLRAMAGAEDFAPSGGKPFAHWVIIPEEMHDDLPVLRAWVARAHALAGVKPASSKKTASNAKSKATRRPDRSSRE